MNFKKLLAYLGSFIFGGVPSVIELWVTEKDVVERTNELYSEQFLITDQKELEEPEAIEMDDAE